jgi:hypothetical protein
MLFDRAVRDACLPADGMPAIAGFERRKQLFPITVAEFRPAQDLAFCARPFEAGFRPLADLLALELCQRGEGGKQDVAYQFVFGGQMLLGK